MTFFKAYTMHNRLLPCLSAAFAITHCGFASKNMAHKNANPDNVLEHSSDKETLPTDTLNPQVGIHNGVPFFETTIAEIEASSNTAIQQANKAITELVSQPQPQLNFQSTFVKLDGIIDQITEAQYRLDVIAQSHPQAAMRDSALEHSKKIALWFEVELYFREDLYKILKTVSTQSTKDLSPEDIELVKATLLEFKRVGLDLPPEKRLDVVELRKKLISLTKDIGKNISEDPGTVTFRLEELKGVPTDRLEQFKNSNSNTYTIETKVSSDYNLIIENAISSETRRKIFIARNQRAMKTNENLIRETIVIRTQIANLMGYKNWADYKTEVKMAKNSDNVFKFIDDFSKRVDIKFKKEQKILQSLKGKEPLNIWDTGFYFKKLKKEKYNIDSEELRNYFPMEATLNGMFSIYERIFGIKITKVKAPYVWFDGVELYAISNTKGDKALGYVYMDMFPRDGKYTHFAQFDLRNGRLLKDGSYQIPVAALLCNFPKPAEGKPSLLRYDEVSTLFHEFGHVLHHNLTVAKYSIASSSIPRDFVEAPSQMLEYWIRDPQILNEFARHYAHPNKKIPEEILKKLQESELASVGHKYKRQLSLAKADMLLHSFKAATDVPKDIYAFDNKARNENNYPMPQNTSVLASFSHLFDDYEAGYYGYAWANAIAADLAKVFRVSPKGFLSAEVGQKLRNEIYATGSLRDVNISIRAFLGRDWNTDALYEYLNLDKKE